MSHSNHKIVDTHFHLWNVDENHYPWLCDPQHPSLVNNRTALPRNYLVSDLLRDIGALDVIAGVHIQAEHDPRDPVRETQWLQSIADEPAARGIPQAIVASADFAAPDIADVLERHCAFRNVRGIRFAVHRRLDEGYDPLLDLAWTANLPLLKAFDLSFDLQLFPQQADAAVALIDRNPGIQFIVTHCGMPFWPDAARRALWRQSMRKYAARANVAVKISGFGGYDAAWNAASIDPIVSEVIAAFGPQRCMLASNYPIEGLVKPYPDIWQVFARYFSAYSADERDMLFWRNAARFYRLHL
jgi:predicted TIM-barrel fold metal-dependent hydrolase